MCYNNQKKFARCTRGDVVVKKVLIKDLLDHFTLELIAGKSGLNREILTSDISRPGIEMTGYFKYFPKQRIQLIGMTEMAYFLNLSEEEQFNRVEGLCDDETPGIIISRGMEVPEIFIKIANEKGVPILQSKQKTTTLISQLTSYLEAEFAPRTALHGVLVDIYGVGVLITGKSGVGKSETALELIKRGHRLVADDRVEIHQQNHDTLIGSPPPIIEHLLEIRGLGIIDVMTLFGTGSVVNQKKISMVIHLETWDSTKHYERLGLDEETIRIIDIDIPRLRIPVKPGRNLAVIVEVAAMNFRMKRIGVNAAQQFSERLNEVIKNGKNEKKQE